MKCLIRLFCLFAVFLFIGLTFAASAASVASPAPAATVSDGVGDYPDGRVISSLKKGAHTTNNGRFLIFQEGNVNTGNSFETEDGIYVTNNGRFVIYRVNTTENTVNTFDTDTQAHPQKPFSKTFEYIIYDEENKQLIPARYSVTVTGATSQSDNYGQIYNIDVQFTSYYSGMDYEVVCDGNSDTGIVSVTMDDDLLVSLLVYTAHPNGYIEETQMVN